MDTADLNEQSGSPHTSGVHAGIALGVEGAAAVVRLDRPQALNALTHEMRVALAAPIRRWERDPQVYGMLIVSTSDRAFCVGGDVVQMTTLGRTDIAAARRSFADEFALCWSLECFTKPTVPLINGPVMGGGVGISLYGTHRVAGENYRFAMPETGIGLFPDDGVTQVFARLPDEIGTYLALTGRPVGPADAFKLGLVTHCIPSAQFAEIQVRFCDADPVDPLLDSRHEDWGAGEIEALRPAIARCFSADTVEEIVSRLARETGASADWAASVRAELMQRAPLSLKVALQQVRRARGQDLSTVLATDFRLAWRFLAATDFYEGVRAQLVDKDRAPKWQPARLEDVTDDMVERCFAPLGADELQLASRAQLQAFK